MNFFLQHLKSGTALYLLPLPRLQILQPHLFPLTDDDFTGRPRMLTHFDGKREKWHGILLKDHFKSEGRSKLPAGTMGERQEKVRASQNVLYL